MTGLILKPNTDGSSVGLQVLDSPSFVVPALEKHLTEFGPSQVLVEERLPGPEGTVAMVQENDGAWQALPPIVVRPSATVYDYQAKYVSESTTYEFADAALAPAMQDLALGAVAACGCRDMARVDVMQDGDRAWRVLEVNTLPGLTSHSLLPKAWREFGRHPGSELRRLCLLAAARKKAGS